MCVEKVCKFHLKKNISPFALPLDGQSKKQKRNKKKKKKGKKFSSVLGSETDFFTARIKQKLFSFLSRVNCQKEIIISNLALYRRALRIHRFMPKYIPN